MPPISPFLRRRSIFRPPTMLNEKFKWATLIHSRKVLCGSSRSGWRGGWWLRQQGFYWDARECSWATSGEDVCTRAWMEKVADLPFAVLGWKMRENSLFVDFYLFLHLNWNTTPATKERDEPLQGKFTIFFCTLLLKHFYTLFSTDHKIWQETGESECEKWTKIERYTIIIHSVGAIKFGCLVKTCLGTIFFHHSSSVVV